VLNLHNVPVSVQRNALVETRSSGHVTIVSNYKLDRKKNKL